MELGQRKSATALEYHKVRRFKRSSLPLPATGLSHAEAELRIVLEEAVGPGGASTRSVPRRLVSWYCLNHFEGLR